MEYKLVVAVRNDLGLSKGKMAVQVAHAAVSCALATQKTYPKTMEGWLKGGQKKVVVKVPGLEEIFHLEQLARKSDIIHKIITDAGRTEVEPGTITCVGIGPERDSVLDDITGKLSLM